MAFLFSVVQRLSFSQYAALLHPPKNWNKGQEGQVKILFLSSLLANFKDLNIHTNAYAHFKCESICMNCVFLRKEEKDS